LYACVAVIVGGVPGRPKLSGSRAKACTHKSNGDSDLIEGPPEQEVVIVGYTEPRRSRKYFGSLALAVRDKAEKRWIYAGHVGTGFDQAALKSLYETMQPLRSDKKPFRPKSEVRKRHHMADPKACRRGKIHRVDE
jgi:ATP dependent DNA ligase C terminal region